VCCVLWRLFGLNSIYLMNGKSKYPTIARLLFLNPPHCLCFAPTRIHIHKFLPESRKPRSSQEKITAIKVTKLARTKLQKKKCVFYILEIPVASIPGDKRRQKATNEQKNTRWQICQMHITIFALYRNPSLYCQSWSKRARFTDTTVLARASPSANGNTLRPEATAKR